MSVGAWGFGTGATGTGAHPFSLRVQGVDYIGSVPIESIAVNASVSSNATLTFTVIDPAATLPVPAAWADVELLDTTEQEWLFGGVVMGVEVSYFGPLGVRMDIRCVDYGVLLDVTPVTADVVLQYMTAKTNVQRIAGVAPLGGLMALEEDEGSANPVGRLPLPTSGSYDYLPGATSLDAGSIVRTGLDSVASGIVHDDTAITYEPSLVYVSPLRQIAVHQASVTWGSAPLEIRQDPTTVGHVAAEAISVDRDHRNAVSGYWHVGGEYIAGGTVNGYTVVPGPPSSTVVYLYGALPDTTISGQATVVCAKNFLPGQALVVDYPAIGLDGTYAITAVSTRFRGGTSLMRQVTVQFNGERGTVARFNRTRFARAGVTT